MRLATIPRNLGLGAAVAATVALAPLGGSALTAPQVQYGAVVVQTDPSEVAVAITLRFPAGSAMDPRGEEGTAHLLAQVLEEEANRRLARDPSTVTVNVTRDEFLVNLLTAPEDWRTAVHTVRELLSDAALPEATLLQVRERQAQRLLFEEGAPVRDFELERIRLVRGSGSPAARPVGGTRGSLDATGVGELGAYRSTHLDPGTAVAAVVGPLTPDEVQAVLPGDIRTAPAVSPFADAAQPRPSAPLRAEGDTLEPPPDRLPPPLRTRLRTDALAPLAPPAAPAGSMAWSSGDRREIDRELTSVWMAVAWPFPPGTPRTLLEFLAVTLQEGLVSVPPDPGLYQAETVVEVLGGQPILTVSVAADPREAARWEARVLGAMDAVVEEPPLGSFFDLSRRRFRNAVLLDMAGSLERSRWLARTVAELGEVPDPQAEIWRLTRDGLSQAAASAGPPRVFILGPLDMMGNGG